MSSAQGTGDDPREEQCIMNIPTFWPDGTLMAIEDRIHFMAYPCGTVICGECGEIIAQCPCILARTSGEIHLHPGCHLCRPELVAVVALGQPDLRRD